MKHLNKIILILVTTLSLIACKKETEFIDPLLTNRDTTINPADDFFMYANNGWFKKHPIPASERSNGIFRMIQDTINNQVKNICEKAAKDEDALKGSNKQKIGDFYASGMDSLAINKGGINPLRSYLSKIESINDVKSVINTMAYLHTIGTGSGFTFYVYQDDKNSAKNALHLVQGGIGLGERDYYFNTDAQSVKIRTEYVKHLQKILELAGDETTVAANKASVIMNIETDLASASRKMEALRDPIKNYNKFTMAQLNKLTPLINWEQTMANFKVKNADTVIVGQPEFFINFNKMLTKYSVDDWKAYLKWDLINTYAAYLSQDFEQQNFYFYSTVMTGIKEQKPRWKRVVEQTNGSLGELIGQVYIEEYLPKGSKEKLLEIGNNIRDVYAERIKKLDWMSEVTKVKALSKLKKVVMKVGYPDKWKDLSSISIERNSYCNNVMAVNKWSYNEMISKFGKPVDRTEWQMYPQTYNAYYSPSNNEICVPACNIIVPGFEGRMPDDAILYGIIGGSTFGHEITHGFDDQGSQYDENGNLKNWWTEDDYKKFRAKTKLIVEQFNKYNVVDELYVNGDATQGENIADLGGVVMGYEAFKKTNQFKNNETISGLTPNQRYYLAYAYAWMVNTNKEALANQVMTDVHSPAKYRINGPLSNIPEFYKTFNITPKNKMYLPENERVSIW